MKTDGNYLNRREFLGLAGAAAVGAGAVSGCGLIKAGTSPMPPSHPSDVALRAMLDAAIAAGEKYVRIPPGNYYLGSDPKNLGAEVYQLIIRNAHDLEIDARGATLVMTDALRFNGVSFRNCSGVKLRGAAYDCEQISFTQGTIVETGPKDERMYLYYLRIDEGYESNAAKFMDEAAGRALRPVSFFEPVNLGWKTGILEPMIERIEQLDTNLWRLRARMNTRCNHPVVPGDKAAVSYRGPSAFVLKGCKDMVFEDVTVYNTPSIAYHELNGEGGMTLRRCKVLAKPGTANLLSSVGGSFVPAQCGY